MVCAGAALPAVSQAAAPLIAAGSAAAAAALILPRLQSVDFGGVFKGEIKREEPATPGLRTDEWKLQRFAWLVCGNAEDARELVEEALANARVSRLPAAERGVYELRSLAAMLENVREHALLRRPASSRARRRSRPADDVVSEECRPTLEALAKLPVRARMAYLLRCSWLLSLEEVAQIVAGTPSEVSEAIAQGRLALAAVQ